MKHDAGMDEWLVIMLTKASQFNNGGYMSNPQAFMVKELWIRSLDDGAVRTLWCYMHRLPFLAFTYVAWKYHNKYASDKWLVWNVNNPSAALVSLLRYTFYEDGSFMRMYRVGRYAT